MALSNAFKQTMTGLVKDPRSSGCDAALQSEIGQYNSTKLNQTITIQKGAHKRVISGWKPITTANVASLYNEGGDPHYAEKLNFILGLFHTK